MEFFGCHADKHGEALQESVLPQESDPKRPKPLNLKAGLPTGALPHVGAMEGQSS